MIKFTNPGEIDVRSISTFGVSVKDGSNPIGFFGTGLKYAIAVLLRTGHDVTILSGLKVVTFAVSKEDVRGQDFDFVTMAIDGGAPTPIGFTTELGKQWELWMAYREIACNCKDEGGTAFYTNSAPAAQAGQTVILVHGQAFEAVFQDSHLYILEDEPAQVVGTTEVRNYQGSHIYFRGVRVMQLPKHSLFTYNLNSQITLTEDRTVKSPWDVYHRLAEMVLRSTDKSFLRDVLTAEEGFVEGGLDLHGWSIQPSAEFLEVTGHCLSDRRCKVNGTAIKVWKDCTKQVFSPKELELSKVQQMSMRRALDFCKQLGFPVEQTYPIKVVESLGDGILGLAEGGTVYIAERVFHLGGAKQLASTLIEEYVHLKHGYRDLTRELQSFLFEKLVSVGEEMTGEPL